MGASVEALREPSPRRGIARISAALALGATVAALAGQAVGAPVGVFGALAAAGALVFFPTIGTVLFFAVAWMNAPVVVTRAEGNPWLLGVLAAGLLLVPAFVQTVVLRRGPVLDRTFLLMMLFLGSLLLSTLVAHDYDIAFAWIGTYVAEGLVLYLLVVNAVRDRATLRRVLWMLLIASALMSSFAIYQEVTRNYDQSFGGFAGRKIDEDAGFESAGEAGLIRDRERLGPEDRACGPVDDPNHFAQILLVALPMGLMLGWSGRNRFARVAAFLLSGLIVSGILLTYSRGGFLVLAGLLLLLIVLGYLRARHALGVAALLVTLVIAVAPGYLDRVSSIQQASNVEEARDAAVRGRVTEMLAAWNVLLDHPIVGVGPGQYTPFYSLDYMDDPGVAFRQIDKERRAHSLYFELGAETGLLGLSMFLGIAAFAVSRLRDVRANRAASPEAAHLATGIGLALLAYLGTGLLLSLAFMRYWWLTLALAGVAVRVAREPSREDRDAAERAVLRGSAG